MLELNKQKVKNTSLLLFIILIFLGILVTMIIFIKPVAKNNTAHVIQQVLDQKEEKRYQVGDFLNNKLPSSVSTYFFKLKDNKSFGNNEYVVLTRITGMSGPVAVVFKGDDKTADFMGIAGITDSQTDPIEYGITETMIRHWKSTILNIYLKGVME